MTSRLTLLVTGGAGYIGSQTVRLLQERGHRVLVFDSLERGNRLPVGDAELIVGDITNASTVAAVVEAHPLDAVIHFAGLKSVEESLSEPGEYFRVNVGGTLTLAEALTHSRSKSGRLPPVIFSSTCGVYGDPDVLPVTETATLRPLNPYAASKLMAEQLLDWFWRTRGLRTVSLRYFNAAGAALDGSIGDNLIGAPNLLPRLIGAALGSEIGLKVFGADYPTPDGTAIRDYVHVADLAEAHLAALEYLASGGAPVTLNIGGGAGTSVAELIAITEAVTSRRIDREFVGRRLGDPAAIWADNSRANALLGWRPRYGIEDIVSSAWRWQRLQQRASLQSQADPAHD